MNELRADFLPDGKLGMYQGPRCELPDGEVVEVSGRKTPLFDLARKLDALGFSDSLLQAHTPTGTPSLRGLVKIMAGLRVEERDRGGMRLRKFEPFPGAGAPKDGDPGSEGTQVPENVEMHVSGSTGREKAA